MHRILLLSLLSCVHAEELCTDDAGPTRVRCAPAEVVSGGPWIRSDGKSSYKAQHRIVRCHAIAESPLHHARRGDGEPLSILHIGAFDNNVGDNLALDNVQHHVSSALLPHRGSSAAVFHLLDIDQYFLQLRPANRLDTVVEIFTTHARALNVSLLVFGGGGLVQPGYSNAESGWRLPLGNRLAAQLGPIPYLVYGVGVNTFRVDRVDALRAKNATRSGGSAAAAAAAAAASAFTVTERAAMRASILGALAFSVRNDGSHAALLRLFPDDAEVREKLWEIADPGMMLPAERCSLVRAARPASALAAGAADAAAGPLGAVALQPAWNAEPRINNGRMGSADLSSLARFAAEARVVYVPHTPTKDFALQKLLARTAMQLGLGQSSDGRGSVIDRKLFGERITFGHHAALLGGLYAPDAASPTQASTARFDTAVVMRGHGLYLCVALNIPCVALSTQDKVGAFARICGLDDFLVDVAEEPRWAERLRELVGRLQADAAFRASWHEKRDACLHRWGTVARRFHRTVRARFANATRAALLGGGGGDAVDGAPRAAPIGRTPIKGRRSLGGSAWHAAAAAGACSAAAMRRTTLQKDLLGLPLPAGLEAALVELQSVAEGDWKPGMRDRNGRRDPILGSIRSDPAALRYYFGAAADPSLRTICEVGYNWGASSLVWLHANPKASVVSFDLAERAYTNSTLAWLNERYGGRLTLVRGDSTRTIPAYGEAHASTPCDLVLVDGDHSYRGELANVLNFQRLARCEGSKYIMDDCDCTVPHLDTTRAWAEAVRKGAMKPEEGHRTDAIFKESQGFRETREKHTYCAGVIRPAAGSCGS